MIIKKNILETNDNRRQDQKNYISFPPSIIYFQVIVQGRFTVKKKTCLYIYYIVSIFGSILLSSGSFLFISDTYKYESM